MSDKLRAMLKEMQESKIEISMVSDDDSPCTVSEWLSTGCLALDAIMGGGLPVGRVTEMFGDPSTGKSLIAAQVAAYAQYIDVPVVYVDTETAVSKEMMEIVGVDVDNLMYSSPDTVEEVFTIFEKAVDAKKIHDPDGMLLLIWDSIAATSVKQEMANEYGKATMGRHALIISHSLRKFTRQISKERVCCLFLNQTRKKIGVLFGDDTATFGGKAVHFHSSIRVHLEEGKKIRKNKKIVGIQTKALVEKNKVAAPYQEALLPIYFGHGISDYLAAFYYLDDNDLFDKKTGNGWYYFNINDKEVKFQKKNFRKIFDQYYDYIESVIFGTEVSYEDGDDDDS